MGKKLVSSRSGNTVYTKEGNNYVDRSGNIAFTKSGQNVIGRNGNQAAYINHDGTITNSAGQTIGHITSDGRMVNHLGNPLLEES